MPRASFGNTWMTLSGIGTVFLCIVICAGAIVYGRCRRFRIPDRIRRDAAQQRFRCLLGWQWKALLFGFIAFGLASAVFHDTVKQSPFLETLRYWLFQRMMLSVIPLSLLSRRAMRRLFERVYAEGFRLCPDCHYSLRGLPDAGRCPECGREFTHDSLVQAWRDIEMVAFGSLRFTVPPLPKGSE